MGVMQSLVLSYLWTRVDRWDKDLLVLGLIFHFSLMRDFDAKPDAKPAHIVQGHITPLVQFFLRPFILSSCALL